VVAHDAKVDLNLVESGSVWRRSRVIRASTHSSLVSDPDGFRKSGEMLVSGQDVRGIGSGGG